MITTKRVYDQMNSEDGVRILVDSMWPRGIKKEQAGVDIWLKAVAPSSGLRKWFGHDPDKWQEFRDRYAEELTDRIDVVRAFVNYLERVNGTITLLYAAKDQTHNNAEALRRLLSR